MTEQEILMALAALRKVRPQVGPAGQPGVDGLRGEPGQPGERGDRGEPGAPGLDGAPGERGMPGEPGPKGDRGEMGPMGREGAKGDRGDDGAPGARGARGEKGQRGERGDKGIKGDRGAKGEQGKQGIFWKGPFKPGYRYAPSEAVEHEGSSWIAKSETTATPATNSRDWDLMAQKGQDAWMQTIEQSVAALEADDVSVAGQIASLDTRVDALEGYDADTRLASLEAADVSLDSRLDTVEGYNAGTRLTSLEASDGTQNTRLTAVESTNTTQNTRLTSLESTDTAHASRLDTLEGFNSGTRLTAIESTDTTQNSRLTAVESLNTTQNTRLTSLESSDTTQNTRLTSVESTNTTQNTRLTSLELTATDWYNVKSYGAAGNGSTDDTTVIQNTINAAAAAGGGTVYLPAGTYKVTSALLLGQKEVQLLGAGSEATIIEGYGSAACIDVTDPGSPFHRGNRISDLKILAHGSKVTGTIGIRLENSLWVSITNVIITGFQYGLSFHPTTQETYLEHVTVDYCSTGVRVVDANQIIATNLMLNFNDVSADLSGAQVFRWFGGLVQSLSTSAGIVHTGAVSSAILMEGIWFENDHRPMISMQPSIGLTGFTLKNCRFTFSAATTGTETFIDLNRIQGGSLTDNRFLYAAGNKLLKVRNSQNIVTWGNDFNTNAASTNLDIDVLSQVHFFGGPGVGSGVGFGRLPVSGRNLTADIADINTIKNSQTTVTGVALVIDNSTTLSTDNNSGSPGIVQMKNNGTEVFLFKPGGRMVMTGAANGGQPGFLVQTPNGRGYQLRSAGGSGEMVQLLSLNSGTTTFVIGGQNTSGVMYLGPGTDTGTAELEINGGTQQAIFKSGFTLKVGSGIRANNANNSRPTASSTYRGQLWYTEGAGGVADTLEVCRKDAAGVYAWVTIV